MGQPFKQKFTVPIPKSAELTVRNGKRVAVVMIKGKRQTFPLTPNGKKYVRPTASYYGQWTDAEGVVHRKKLSRNLGASRTMLHKLEQKAERRRNGLVDPGEVHAGRPLAAHVDDYAEVLESKGDSPGHVCSTKASITAVLNGCDFVYPSDLDVAAVARWLNALRRGTEPARLPDGVALFLVRDAAFLLGITTDAVADHVERHGLEATGMGKARRLSRAAVQFMADRAARGVGPSAINHYIRALKAFSRWLYRSKRMASNPFDTLDLVAEDTDIRRARCELSPDELQRLLSITRASERIFRGLAGEDRYHLLLTAAATGFRANSLANLMPANFQLAGDKPAVTIAARINKSKKVKRQPIPLPSAVEMASYIAGRPAGERVWPGRWLPDAAEMLRLDLTAAGIPYCVEGANGPEYRDFHGMRHTYITMLGRNGVDLRTAQILAGHSTPTLTARYMHFRDDELSEAVENLPTITAGQAKKLTRNLTKSTRIDLHQSAPMCSSGDEGVTGEEGADILEFLEQNARNEVDNSQWAVPGLNRGPNDFQSFALPAELTALEGG